MTSSIQNATRETTARKEEEDLFRFFQSKTQEGKE